MKTTMLKLLFLALTISMGGRASPSWADEPQAEGSIKTKISAVSQEQMPNGDIKVTVQLTDDQARPIGYAPIQFSLATHLGELGLGAKPTDESGHASVLVSGKIRRGQFTLTGQYRGIPPYGPSLTTSELAFAEPGPAKTRSLRPLFPALVPFAKLFKGIVPASVRGQMDQTPSGSLITPYPSLLLVLSLLSIFFSVWGIYLYILSLLWGIKKGE